MCSSTGSQRSGSVCSDPVSGGGARPDSDVDILVELGEPTFDHYMDLKFYLEDVLGAPVDLVLADCVKPRLQPIIAQEVVYA